MNQILKYRTGTKVPVSRMSGSVRYLTFPLLEKTGLVKHGISTREGGVSQGIYATMNLSFTSGDSPDCVRENYNRIGAALGIPVERMVCTQQTHTVNVRKVTEEDCGKGVVKERDYTGVDGLVTNIPGICLVTFYADCVPILFVDPVHRAIGACHSGWRGTVRKMGEVTLKKMSEYYGTRPEDVVAAIGPSICQDCYEVSQDVAEEFARAFPSHSRERTLMYRKPDGKYQLNLWRANEVVLLEAGVRPEHLEITDLCTCCNPELLFSHRASAGKRGNLGAFLALKEA